MNAKAQRRISRLRYPAGRTSPWFFAIVAFVTVTVILAGIFSVGPVTRVVHWLAVVL